MSEIKRLYLVQRDLCGSAESWRPAGSEPQIWNPAWRLLHSETPKGILSVSSDYVVHAFPIDQQALVQVRGIRSAEHYSAFGTLLLHALREGNGAVRI